MPPARYRPLLAYLTALPPEQTAVTLTFAELEALVGPVSGSARTVWSYWSALSRTRTWRTAGWRARLTHINTGVTFTRRAPGAPP